MKNELPHSPAQALALERFACITPIQDLVRQGFPLSVALEQVSFRPLRLPDGTMSRHGGWGTEPDINASFLWNDDQFMGIALLARLARAPGAPAATARRYVDAIAAQHLAFAGYLQDAATGLYKHGYNHATGHRSCCSWGRANGACAACTRRAPAYRPARPPLPSCSSPPRAQAG